MKANELVIYRASDEVWRTAVDEALKYALLSFPFTVNRMGLAHLPSRIANIAKGKLAEQLLRHWAMHAGLPLHFEAGATPFHLPDYFDFSYRGHAFDLKNNFLYHDGELLPADEYIKLPALVPHRFEADQWGRRNDRSSHPHLAKAFLFTYMKQADTYGGQAFFNLHFDRYTLQYLEQHLRQCAGYNGDVPPFDGAAWYSSLATRGVLPHWELRSKPALVVAGMAVPAHYYMFQDVNGTDALGYHPYLGGWYRLRDDGGLLWRGGLLHTRIKNAACPVGFLPAFSSWTD